MHAEDLVDSSTLVDCEAEEAPMGFVTQPRSQRNYLYWHLHLEVGLVLRNVLLICHWLNLKLLLPHGWEMGNVLCHFLLLQLERKGFSVSFWVDLNIGFD